MHLLSFQKEKCTGRILDHNIRPTSPINRLEFNSRLKRILGNSDGPHHKTLHYLKILISCFDGRNGRRSTTIPSLERIQACQRQPMHGRFEASNPKTTRRSLGVELTVDLFTQDKAESE